MPLDEKRDNAIAAAEALIALLERCSVPAWEAHIRPVLAALQAHALEEAVSLYQTIPMTNMGGFLDLILCKENGHTIRDYDDDNRLLMLPVGLSEVLSETCGYT